jgi:hypothetical protein
VLRDYFNRLPTISLGDKIRIRKNNSISRRTAIDFLKLPSGAWISDRLAIGTTLCAHFTDLFANSNPCLPVELLNLFDSVITAEDNLSIYSIPSEQEIHDSVFSIGPTKSPRPDGFTGLFYQKYWY